jgi:hypothetical protein
MFRWAAFRQRIHDIDSAVKKLCNNEQVKYQDHIGGGNYVSVTSGFRCVDFRNFFMPYGTTDIKPTKTGMALRLSEWAQMKTLVDEINNDYPQLAVTLPCYMQDDHQNQLGALECGECFPFSSLTSPF